MTRYTRDSRDRVLDAVDMLTLVSTRSDLRRAGVDSYFGICPFHDERTASFHVRPEEKHYHCFGCQASGDPFDFVMETEGLDFKAALEALADRFGVRLETEDEDPAAAARRTRHERLYSLLGRAQTFYARYLWEAGEAEGARRYLLDRGLAEETLREFRVGYAPSGWDRMTRASRRAGFGDEELLAVGLAQRSRRDQSQLIDRFRGRVMFPSADARGRVRGFGARAMSEDQQPKYLNTSEGELYHKRAQLFGIDLARAPAARAGEMILVEGYTDVLALHQAGLRHGVGIMGTALTEEQVRELQRLVNRLILCLDADRAGQEAMLRAARLTADRGMELRVVPLPEGLDPADLAEREGPEALGTLVRSSVPFVVFRTERILQAADPDSAEAVDRVVAELSPALAQLPVSALRDELIHRAAGRLGLSDARLVALMEAAGSDATGIRSGPAEARPGSPPPAAEAPSGGRRDQVRRNEESFLALCLALPEAGERALAQIDIDALLTVAPLRRAAHHLSGRLRSPLADLPADEEAVARQVADLIALAGRGRTASQAALDHARLVLERARLERALARIRVDGGGGTAELAREREGVLAQIHTLTAEMERTL